MIRPILTLPPKVKTLAQQNADFTAEGAPPPGKVGMSIPETAHESVKVVSRAPNPNQRPRFGQCQLSPDDSPGQGDATVQFLLALVCDSAQDHKQAAVWFQKAAEQGLAVAQWNLGFIYSHGFGVLQDNVEAHKWLSLALINGSGEARKRLEVVEKLLTREQIAEAQRLASEWIKAHK